MKPSFARSCRIGAALSVWFAALLSPLACGQQGIVAATSGDTTEGTGGGGAGAGAAGGMGGTGGTGGAGGTGAAAGAAGSGGVATSNPLKVLTWNLHNFFDMQDDPNNANDFALSAADYSAKKKSAGAVLKEMDPDLIVVQEVESQAILDQLNAEQLGGAYTTAITKSNDFRGLHVGVMSKLVIEEVISHAADSFKRLDLAGGQVYKYSRDAVEVHLTHNSRKLVFLGVHYRSKGDGSPETDDKDKRMAEAQHTRAIADEIMKAAPKTGVVILGDFNDLPGSPPVSWTVNGDPKMSPKILYTDAADSIPEADRYSFVYMGTKELIDHQMMNPLMTMFLDTKSVVIRHGSDVQDVSDHSPFMATYNIQ